MAYSRSRRGSGRRTYGRARSGSGYSRSRSARSSRRPARTTARRGGRGQQTVRIVIEGMPPSPVARPNPFASVLGAPPVDKGGPRKAKL